MPRDVGDGSAGLLSFRESLSSLNTNAGSQSFPCDAASGWRVYPTNQSAAQARWAPLSWALQSDCRGCRGVPVGGGEVHSPQSCPSGFSQRSRGLSMEQLPLVLREEGGSAEMAGGGS